MTLVEVIDCTCEGCVALKQEYPNADLRAFYAKKLLIRGWAGRHLSERERLYLSNHAEWYQASVEKGKRLTANNPINRHAAPSDPVTENGSGVVADLEATQQKTTRKRKRA